MACRRIIACLDVMNGRTVKGVNFAGLEDLGDPAEMAFRYQEQGADEIVLLDITASKENRPTETGWVKMAAERLSIPLTAGGGVGTLAQACALLDAGADKVTVNTAAVEDPGLITEIAHRYGSQCCTVAIDAKRQPERGTYTVLIRGGRENTGIELKRWIGTAVNAGAGELLLTSWDRDGTKSGFDIEMTREAETVVPVIASGGAGCPAHFALIFKGTSAGAALAAGILHRGEYTIKSIKDRLRMEGIEVRPC